jgi:hypothetical protein
MRWWLDRLRRAKSFESPEKLDQFVSEVRAELEAAGLEAAAGRFAEIQATAFTTGSEWLGELGAAAKEIRREKEIPPALCEKLDRIMREARRVWLRL